MSTGLPVTDHMLNNKDNPPGFEVVGKSVVHRWVMKGTEGGPVLTEFCKCRNEEWAKRVAEAMNLRFPEGDLEAEPEEELNVGQAAKFLTHKGVTIYHAYKDREDTVDGSPLDYHYSTSECACIEEFEFDVRDLPGFRPGIHNHEARIKEAIDKGWLKEEEVPKWPGK